MQHGFYIFKDAEEDSCVNYNDILYICIYAYIHIYSICTIYIYAVDR